MEIPLQRPLTGERDPEKNLVLQNPSLNNGYEGAPLQPPTGWAGLSSAELSWLKLQHERNNELLSQATMHNRAPIPFRFELRLGTKS